MTDLPARDSLEHGEDERLRLSAIHEAGHAAVAQALNQDVFEIWCAVWLAVV